MSEHTLNDFTNKFKTTLTQQITKLTEKIELYENHRIAGIAQFILKKDGEKSLKVYIVNPEEEKKEKEIRSEVLNVILPTLNRN